MTYTAPTRAQLAAWNTRQQAAHDAYTTHLAHLDRRCPDCGMRKPHTQPLCIRCRQNEATHMRFPDINIPPWYEQAACANSANPEAWYPNPTDRHPAAMETCNGCPVQTRCLDYALTEGIREGIWGGMTEDQRATLGRRQT